MLNNLIVFGIKNDSPVEIFDQYESYLSSSKYLVEVYSFVNNVISIAHGNQVTMLIYPRNFSLISLSLGGLFSVEMNYFLR